MTPARHARDLLQSLGFDARNVAPDARDEARLWAASGAACLTGTADGPPLGFPAPLAVCAQGAWLALAALAPAVLDPRFRAFELLGERAAILGLSRRGSVSVGGSCRLLDCADGQLALNLPREDDWELLPAWLQRPIENWQDLADAVTGLACKPLAARARLLGLAAAPSQPPVAPHHWFREQRLAPAHCQNPRVPLVLDLSALWAGPLCTQILAQLGARVIKVESVSRPDGARAGPARFFDLMNAGKQSVMLDLDGATGRRQLAALLGVADIIVESARPRALAQMGIDATDYVRAGRGRVWLSITGYGREPPMGAWIAYGDDAGVGAGLSWLLRQAYGANLFCADAIADPLTGLHAALLAWAAWSRGGGVLLDVPLTGVLSRCVATARVPAGASALSDTQALPPVARTPLRNAAAPGSDTAGVLREFGIDA